MPHITLRTFIALLLFSLSISSFAYAFPADFDGDGKQDLVVYRRSGPDTGKWFVMPSNGTCTSPMTAVSGGCSFQWGLASDTPVSGDFDSDFKADFVVRRPGTIDWYIYYSGGGGSTTIQFGNTSGDIVEEGDTNGDNRSDLFYTSNPYSPPAHYVGRWYFPPVVTFDYSGTPGFGFGGAAIGDYQTRFANFSTVTSRGEPGLSFIQTINYFAGQYSLNWVYYDTDSGTNVATSAFYHTITIPFGTGLPTIVKGNLGGPGPGVLDDFTYFRNGLWTTYFNRGNGTSTAVTWGATGDIPLTGQYDGDSIDDRMVWRPSDGTWYLLPSTGVCPKTFCGPSYTTTCAPYFYGGCYRQWGLTGDLPLS